MTATRTMREAFIEAYAEIQNPKKNANNPAFKSKYANLEEMLNVTKPVLVACGFALCQQPVSDDGRVGVHTRLLHDSGDEMDFGSFTVDLAKHDAQGAGSAITYCRRYAIGSVFGLAQEDDDGNGAARQPKQQPAKTPAQEDVVLDAYRDLKARADENGNWERIKAHLLIDNAPAKTAEQALAAYRSMTAGARKTLWTLANATD